MGIDVKSRASVEKLNNDDIRSEIENLSRKVSFMEDYERGGPLDKRLELLRSELKIRREKDMNVNTVEKDYEIALNICKDIVEEAAISGYGLMGKYSPKRVKDYLDNIDNKDVNKAFFTLGNFYSDSRSNADDSILWFTKAADGGCADSCVRLAEIYYKGHMTLKDDKKVLKYYLKAAKMGESLAQHNLGIFYSIGDVVSKNNTIAYMWLNIAASKSNGYSKSTELRKKISKEMTLCQIELAQKLSREWSDDQDDGSDILNLYQKLKSLIRKTTGD